MKRIVSLIAVLILIVTAFAGCGDKKADNGKNTESTVSVSDDIFSTEKINYFDADGKSAYTIVHAETPTEAVSTGASKIQKNMKDTLKVSAKKVKDKVNDADSYEILVGNVDRPEAGIAKDYLVASCGGKMNDFIICSIGKKIVILGMSEAAITSACDYFIANYIKPEGIEGGIKYTYATEGNYTERKINGAVIGKYKIVRQHYNGSYLTQIELEKLVETVEKEFGYHLDIVEDAYVAEGDYEIVVGDTNRSGSENLPGYDDVKIAITDKKVFVNGGHSYSTAAAVTEFTKMLLKADLSNSDSVTTSYGAVSSDYDFSNTYKAVWHDDFDGNEIDTANWRIVSGTERSSAGKNGKRSVRSNDPQYLGTHDGKLYMVAGQDDNNYYGEMITTDKTMSYKYGFLEFSQILPQGPGFWIATWLSSNDPKVEGDLYHLEIDINEMFGNSSVVASNCHRWPTALGKELGLDHTSLDGKTYGTAKKRYSLDDRNFNQDFHTFGCISDPAYYAFTCDGEIYFKYDFRDDLDIDAFTHSTFIRLSMAVGFDSCSQDINNATQEEWQNSNIYYTDHIYLYQMDNGIHEFLPAQ